MTDLFLKGMQQPVQTLPSVGLSTPVSVAQTPPVRSRAFEFDFYTSPAQFIAQMRLPSSPAAKAFTELLGWTGINQPHGLSRGGAQIIAVSGNSLVAAGLAMRLAAPTLAGTNQILMLEWAQPSPILASLFGKTHPMGLTDLFAGRCDLNLLMAAAPMPPTLPQLYVIGQGTLRPAWSSFRGKLASLVQPCRRKFHYIIISLPLISTQLETLAVLSELRAHHCLLYDPADTLLSFSPQIQQAIPHGILHRLT